MADTEDKKPVDSEKQNKTEEPKELATETILGRLKRFMIPLLCTIGSFLLAAVLFTYVFNVTEPMTFEKNASESKTDSLLTAGPSKKITPEPETPPENRKESRKPEISAPIEPEDDLYREIEPDVAIEKLVIDTAEILKSLESIFVVPEEAAAVGLTVEDSIDTINWLEKEMIRLSDEKEYITRHRRELEELAKKIERGLADVDQERATRLAGLARLYDGMDPEEAARLFTNLDDDMVVSILPRMKPANASKILELLPARRAAKISTMLITVLEE